MPVNAQNRHGGWSAPVRREAGHRRALVLEAAGLAPGSEAETILRAALDAADLRCRPLPAHDALLSGAQAVLDAEAQTVWVRNDLADDARRLVIAHELAHHYLHHDEDEEDSDDGQEPRGCTPDDFEPADGVLLAVGYGPRERREAEANLFAREFLLPSALVRAWFFDENLCADRIAARVGLAPSLVFAQLSETLGLTTADAVAADAPAADAPAAENSGALQLDDSQRAAAQHAEAAPLLVGAGPGTGKTRTLVARVLFLNRDRGEAPESLLALTFSRRAAEEMRERIAAEAPRVARRAFISTFHAFGLDLLRRHWQAAALPPRPVLLDRVDAVALLEQHVAHLGLRALRYLHDPAFPLPEIVAVIHRAKEDLIRPDAFAARAAASGDARLMEAAGVYAVYERLLQERGALDFGDLVARAVRLLEENEAVRRAEQDRWRHVLVDEYQDVNPAGARLARLLAGGSSDAAEGRGPWAVGDLRQAIYGWRGASVGSVAGGWERDYPGGRRQELAVNYRSRPALVAAFGVACGEGPTAWRPARVGENGEEAPETTLTLGVAPDERAQADHLARRIFDFDHAGYGFGGQAVLCRTRAQAAVLRAELASRGVPVGGSGDSLFASPDVKNLLALLARVVEPDGPARHRVPAGPPPGLSWTGSASRFFATTLFGPPGGARRVENPAAVRALLALAQNFDERAAVTLLAGGSAGASPETGRAFLRHVRRVARLGGGPGAGAPADEENSAPADAVRVLTVHAAKGLEFPVVFVPSLSAGKFPARGRPNLLPPLPPRANQAGEDTGDEEARLFFVALTRARDHLVLSRAERYNGRRAEPSPLLACLDDAGPLVRREVWEAFPAPASAAAPVADAALPADALTLEAWEAELYLRCPRRYFYERVLLLPVGELPPYHTFRHAVRETLRALPQGGEDCAGPLTENWTRFGPDPAHPHTPLYRQAAQEITGAFAARRAGEDSGSGNPRVFDAASGAPLTAALDNGEIRVRADRDPARHAHAPVWECHTFRRPPRDGKVSADERHTLLREAIRQNGERNGEQMGATSSDALPPLVLRHLQAPGDDPLPISPGTPAQRKKHLAAYDAALRGIRLQVFPPTPREPDDCAACPYFFICPA